jgi:hypothetical protein
MPDGVTMRLAESDLNWHDGILVDLRIDGIAKGAQDIELLLDLYVEPGKRQRFRCVGADLRRILLSGDMKRLTREKKSGNVDFMRMDFTADTEILSVSLFGGVIEAEASEFQLTEADQ